MKIVFCDRCGEECGKVKVGAVHFFAMEFPVRGKSYNRTDLSVTGELCEKCAEELSSIINKFLDDGNAKKKKPEASEVSSSVIDPELKTYR